MYYIVKWKKSIKIGQILTTAIVEYIYRTTHMPIHKITPLPGLYFNTNTGSGRKEKKFCSLNGDKKEKASAANAASLTGEAAMYIVFCEV
jgi:hypothetical protein